MIERVTKVAIVGSRDYPKLDRVADFVRTLDPSRHLIISGGAKGVDSVAVETAKRCGMRTRVFLPDWDTHGRRAGFLRNAKIVGDADLIIAFWTGKSAGTKHSLDLAIQAQKPTLVILP